MFCLIKHALSILSDNWICGTKFFSSKTISPWVQQDALGYIDQCELFWKTLHVNISKRNTLWYHQRAYYLILLNIKGEDVYYLGEHYPSYPAVTRISTLKRHCLMWGSQTFELYKFLFKKTLSDNLGWIFMTINRKIEGFSHRYGLLVYVVICHIAS